MQNPSLLAAAIASAILLSPGLTPTARSQIIPDTTLPNNSIVTPNSNRLTIDGGTVTGGNLFHSFSEFSVPAGSEALFNNEAAIDNIITRVTGGKISQIDGLIRANGTANLFLLNPNGIVFGKNARLDLGGSFIGSTADGIELSDGSFYSAIAPNAPPLLTINVPIGLQFGGNSGTVEVRGEGHRLAISQRNPDLLDRSSVVPNLEVNPDRTLALFGNTVNLTGSTVSATGGHLELGSPRTGTVALIPRGEGWDFDYADISAWGDVRLSQQALADASGDNSSIAVRAGTFELREGSLLLLQNSGTTPAGNIRIEATDRIFATGTTTSGRISSGIITHTLGEGNGADVEIEANRLMLERGATFKSTTFGAGNAGRWQANIRSSIEIVGFSPFGSNLRSNLASLTRASGNAGAIALATQQLRLADGGFISASSRGSGTGSNISIAAELVELTGYTPNAASTSSTIGAASFATGDAGSIEIDTVRLRLRDGSSVGATGFAEGNGGSVRISATESISISGGSPTNLPSQVRAEVRIAVPFLRQAFNLPDTPSGEAGNVAIETPSLQITDGARISVANEGIRAAGTLQIRAEAIALDSTGHLVANTVSGEGGDIILDTQILQLRGGSFISAAAEGRGNGGNLTVNTNSLALLENGSITANAVQGLGGNITITTGGLFVSPDSSITASSQFGVSGTVTVNNPDLDPSSGLIELSTEAIDPSQQITTGCAAAEGNYFAITGRGGLAEDPTAIIRGSTVWRDWQDYSAVKLPRSSRNQQSVPSFAGAVGNLQANSPTTPIEANALIVHPDGRVELAALATNSRSIQLNGNCPSQKVDTAARIF